MAGKSSETITADARVVLARDPYLGLEMNVSSPGPAVSIPATPVISVSGGLFSRRAPSLEAISASFMRCAIIVRESDQAASNAALRSITRCDAPSEYDANPNFRNHCAPPSFQRH